MLQPIEALPLGVLMTAPDGLEWSLAAVPRQDDQGPLYVLWIRHGKLGVGGVVGDRREVVSGAQAAKSLCALAAALGVEGVRMSTDLMDLVAEKQSELEEVITQMVALEKRKALLTVDVRELKRAAARIEQARTGVSPAKGDKTGPPLIEQLATIIKGEPSKVFTAPQLADQVGAARPSVSTALAHLVNSKRIKRVGRGEYQSR